MILTQITDFFNKLWQIQSPENDPRIKAIEFVPRTQQVRRRSKLSLLAASQQLAIAKTLPEAQPQLLT